jgi:predicted nucleic acid-binding protein
MALALVDANVPIYAAGSAHPLKGPCGAVLRMVAEVPGQFLTDAEVLQEMLHYYLRRNLASGGLQVVEEFADLMEGRVEPVSREDVLAACLLARGAPADVPARDYLHLAIARRAGATFIVSADTDFDRLEGIERLDPAGLEEWRHLIAGPGPSAG